MSNVKCQMSDVRYQMSTGRCLVIFKDNIVHARMKGVLFRVHGMHRVNKQDG